MNYELLDRLYMLSDREKIELIIEFLLSCSEYKLFEDISDKFLKQVDL